MRLPAGPGLPGPRTECRPLPEPAAGAVDAAPGRMKGEIMINLDRVDCPRCGGETGTAAVTHDDVARMLTVCLACGALVGAVPLEPWRVSAQPVWG